MAERVIYIFVPIRIHSHIDPNMASLDRTLGTIAATFHGGVFDLLATIRPNASAAKWNRLRQW